MDSRLGIDIALAAVAALAVVNSIYCRAKIRDMKTSITQLTNMVLRNRWRVIDLEYELEDLDK